MGFAEREFCHENAVFLHFLHLEITLPKLYVAGSTPVIRSRKNAGKPRVLRDKRRSSIIGEPSSELSGIGSFCAQKTAAGATVGA